MTSTYTYLFLILFTIFSLSHQIPFNVNNIDQKSGIFYHNMGKVLLYSDQLTLLTFTNITFYVNKLQITKNMFTKSTNICNHIHEFEHVTYHCSNSLKLIQIQIPNLERKLETITHLVGHRHENPNRKRRGIVNGISTALKWLFGVPDADDAKYYDEAIKSLVNKNRETQILMQQQIHIMSSSIQTYNETLLALKTNEERLNQNFKKINDFEHNVNNKITHFALVETVNDHISLLNELVSELNEEYDIIISSILFAKQNIIHPNVISPKNLREELIKIKSNANIILPIPVINYDNIYKYYSICKLNAVYNNELLIFTVKIPITTDMKFNLYNLIPIPTFDPKSNTYTYIDPTYPFLIINPANTRYGRMKDLMECQQIDGETKLCKDPITYLTSQKYCEISLRENPRKIPEDCPTKIIKANLEIYHKISPLEWIFVVTEPITATISCEPDKDKFHEATLNGTGILRLDPHCRCYTLSALLISTNNITANYTNYIPNLDITTDDCCVKEIEKLGNMELEPIQLTNVNLDELRHAKHKLQQFEETLQTEINKPFLGEHHTLFNIILSVLVIMIILLILCCCCCRYCCDCTWLPYIGRFIPKKKDRTCMALAKYHSDNQSISNSNIFINSPVSEQNRRALEMVPQPSSEPKPTVSKVDSQSYRNPYLPVKSRRSITDSKSH